MTLTYFDALPRSYVDVDTSKGVDTQQFLEATEGVVKLFDLLGSTAFAAVQKDMNGNIKKIRDRLLANPAANANLQDLLANESSEKKRVATEGLLWLTSLNNTSEELNVSFTKAYEETLKKHHNMFVRPVFALAMKACPYRQAFYEKLGVVTEAAREQMETWLKALESIITIIQKVFEENPAYIKGM
ncbi:glycolipid transfer protein domain-containing protein [Mycotypha africana]|uniref:glycolipid transfer protein domain-containing protein n=1 Tax=Mycotypha africana TaxID=64632 RepID=UPI002300ECD9|nr:glycolipid transfer protein domain-containing protein [Mycotypha africana]KAI8984179.1 glycolipid transfer protein domain-containing protein [Mycotypha africana]